MCRLRHVAARQWAHFKPGKLRATRDASWIADSETFDCAAEQYQAGIRADVSKRRNAELVAQRDRVVAITST